jgi:predicted Zn-ribbon and HTH transcriptional regulator
MSHASRVLEQLKIAKAGASDEERERIEKRVRELENEVGEIEIVEYYCRGCGWTEPQFQAGDPAYCPGCSVEYEPSYVFAISTEGGPYQPPTRTRTWPRCGEWTQDNKRCENRTPGGRPCHHHGGEDA